MMKKSVLCHIARSNNIDIFLYCEDANDYSAIAICKDFCLGIHNTSQRNNETFFTVNCKKQQGQQLYLYCNEWATTTTLFTPYCEGASKDNKKFKHHKMQAQIARVWQWKVSHTTINFFRCCWSKWWWQWACSARSDNNRHIFNVVLQIKRRQLYFWCCKKQSYCQGACNDSESTIARCKDATINFLICCWSKDDTTTNNVWLGAQDCAKQQPTKPLHGIAWASNYRKTMTLSARWSILYFIRCIKKSFNNDKILFGQAHEATTKVDCNNNVRKIA